MSSSIKKRSIQSSVYNISSSGIQTVVQFFRTILLARILAPQDFGVYTLATSYILITRTFPLFGLNSALIHRSPESDSENGPRVHFTLSLLFNAIWAIVMVMLSFYLLVPQTRIVLWAILATEIIDNLLMTARTLLVKRLEYRRIAYIDTTSTIIGSLAAIGLAMNGFGVWSLVFTDIVPALIGLVGLYIYRPVWKPGIIWHRTSFRYFLDFGSKNLLVNLLTTGLDRVDDIWTGNSLGDLALGYYSRAYAFATYPRRILAGPISNISLSTYAEIVQDRSQLSRSFYWFNAFLIRSGFYLAGTLTLIAPEFIHIVLTDKWLPMLLAFRLMLVYTLLDPINVTTQNIFTAVGVQEIVSRIRAIQLVILLSGLFTLGRIMGITGVALAVDAMLVIGIFLLFWRVREFVSFSLKALFLIPGFALATGLIASFLISTNTWISSSYWLSGFTKAAINTVFYFGILFLFEKQQLTRMLNMFLEYSPLKRFRKTNGLAG